MWTYFHSFRSIPLSIVFAAMCSCAAVPSFAQDLQPEAPKPAPPKPQAPTTAGQPPDANQAPDAESKGQRGSRVFGVMPNQLTVEGATVVSPISPKEKFKLVAEGAFDPYEFVVVGFLAGIGQADNNTPEWGQGAQGYGIRYAADLGDLVIGNFMVGAVMPSLFHQDPRYFQSGKGSFWHRTGYAMSRVIITRGDSGKKEFNISEIGGNAIAGALSSTYHPPNERSLGEASQTFATQLAVDAVGFELKEFWPDIRRHFTKKKKPQPQN